MLKSLSLFVGTASCNANCAHCAGIIHRKYAPKKDGIINEKLIRKTLIECYEKGAKSLSISSSGEPTLSPLSVTKALSIVNSLKNQNIEFNPINLYSNGIRIGEDKPFCEKNLPIWKSLGLSTIYITVHDIDERNNARFYRVKSYPSIEEIFSRIHKAEIKTRANIVLTKQNIPTKEIFVSTIKYLRLIGADSISAWPIRDSEDRVSKELSPLELEIEKMHSWVEKNKEEYSIRLLDDKHQDIYVRGEKLTLFPDGLLSNKWCKQ